MVVDFSMSKKYLLHGCIVFGLLVLVVVCGCMTADGSGGNKNTTQPDPETGVVAWIAAMNTHDASNLYYLAPDELKAQISEQQFVTANMNNTLLEPDKSFIGYKIMNETGNATLAHLEVMVLLNQNQPSNATKRGTIPLFMNFAEWYEHGEWKVWSIPFS
jgi:hypothetical protein